MLVNGNNVKIKKYDALNFRFKNLKNNKNLVFII